jgi:hypothetical protein
MNTIDKNKSRQEDMKLILKNQVTIALQIF